MLHDFKIYFYVNSYADKLFGKRKRVGYFVTMCLVVCRYDGCGTAVTPRVSKPHDYANHMFMRL
jgi:hypothetical protein